jgi:type II secretory pathway component PulF
MIKSNFIYILVILTLLFIFLRRGSYRREEKLYSQYPLKGSIIIKIDKILFKKSLERDKSVPFLTWLNSLSQDDGNKIEKKKLFSIISKYYDLRFTSKLDKKSIEKLKREIKDWKRMI